MAATRASVFLVGLPDLVASEPASLQRRNAGAIQRLADIDIAEPRDQSLVEQRGLDRGGLALEARGKPFRREGRAQRLDAEALEQSVLLEPLGRE